MKRYIIHKHYEATKKNDNFFGTDDAVGDFFHGKGYTSLAIQSKVHSVEEISEYMIREYGYSTKAAASKAFNSSVRDARWEEERGFWKVSTELLEVEVSE